MVQVNFKDHFDSIDSGRWTSLTNGTGSVTASDSNAVLDEGGSATSAAAALVLTEPLDLSLDWIAYSCFRWDAASMPGAYTPPPFSIIDSSGTPAVMSNASWNSARRVWFENQISGGGVEFNRFAVKFRQSTGLEYLWQNDSSNQWSTSFEYSWRWPNEDNYLICAFHYTAAGSGTLRWAGWGIDNEVTTNNNTGMRLAVAPTARIFGTGTAEIDPIDDDAYLVLGHPVNDAGGLDATLSVEWCALYEVEGHNDEHAWTSRKEAFGSSYTIHHHTCPRGMRQNGTSLWFPDPDARGTNSALFSLSSEDYHNGPFVYDDQHD